MAEHTDNWGAMMEVLREIGPALSLLKPQPVEPEAGRAYLRWMFDALEAFTFCLKRISLQHAEQKDVELSRREREVLGTMKEPSFPGLPPPRRVGVGMRESLGVALNVYARARGKETPLREGRLPTIFIDASVIHDRIAHPETPADLRLNEKDLRIVVEFLRWFETIRTWLYADRKAEIEEMGVEMTASFDTLRRKLLDDGDERSSG